MSRVDEARRRAAEAAAQGGATAPPTDPTPDVGVDPAEFGSESYPVEMPDSGRRHVDQEQAAAPAVPAPAPSAFEGFDGNLVAKMVVDQRMTSTSREQY